MSQEINRGSFLVKFSFVGDNFLITGETIKNNEHFGKRSQIRQSNLDVMFLYIRITP